MQGPSNDDLRRLAVWMSRRRELEETMAVLTQYGPTANDRVASHLHGLRTMLDAEREAFERYAAGAPALTQLPMPALGAEHEQDAPNVHPLFAARLARRT